jgi:hypothetical protein
VTGSGLSGPYRLRSLLVAICLIMLAVIAAELTPSESGSPSINRARPPPQPEIPNAPSFTMPPATAFAEILARPLFSRTRRPAAQAGNLPASSSLTLVAIVISDNERHALLASGQPPKTTRVREGDEIAGWTVEAIKPDKVIVRRADAREEVKPKGFGRANTTKPLPVTSSVSGGEQIPPQHRPAHDQ